MSSSLRFALVLGLLSGCATSPAIAPVSHDVESVPLPVSTRVLGEALVYISASGERLEVVHDNRVGIAIVKLPDGVTVILPAEIVGSEGRYRNDRVTVWEQDGTATLVIDGKPVFSGRISK